MAKVGAQRAAELTGVSKSTIQRAMKDGRVSYSQEGSRRTIDVSELERVFGLLSTQSQSMGTSSATQSANFARVASADVQSELRKASEMLEFERLKMEIKMLREKLDDAESHITDLRAQRDQWQRQAQQVLLTSQYSQKQAEDLQAELKEHERREAERRKLVMEARMKKMHGQNQNAIASVKDNSKRPLTSTDHPEQNQNSETSMRGGVRQFWRKLRGAAA